MLGKVGERRKQQKGVGGETNALTIGNAGNFFALSTVLF